MTPPELALVVPCYNEASRLDPDAFVHFLTGHPGDIERLRRGLGFRDPDPRIDADRSQHAGIIAMGNGRTSRWAAACPATCG